METSQNTNLSAIDKALAAAKARKAGKLSQESGEPMKKISSEERAAAKAERDQARALRKQQLAEARAAKREAASKPAHMKKVEKAGSKLPALNDQAQLLFNEATANFSAEQITAISLHLQHFNRVKATERAINQTVSLGQTVRILGGDPKFIGMTGTVCLARRIRCFVEVPGFKKPAYCFTSDVEVIAEAAATGTEG
jgi:hypothetical protein